MSIFSRLFGTNPIDSLNFGDLRKAEAQLQYQIQTLQNEQTQLKEQTHALFSEVSSITDETEASICAMRIKTISETWMLKAESCQHLEQDLYVISNLTAIKEQEKTLKQSGVWKKLQHVDPDALEGWLVRSSIKTSDHRSLMDELSDITSEHISQTEMGSVDVADIVSLIAEVRAGNLSSGDAKNKLFHNLSSEQPDVLLRTEKLNAQNLMFEER